MSNENGDAPKVEGAEIARTDGQAESAEPDRAAEKGKIGRASCRERVYVLV